MFNLQQNQVAASRDQRPLNSIPERKQKNKKTKKKKRKQTQENKDTQDIHKYLSSPIFPSPDNILDTHTPPDSSKDMLLYTTPLQTTMTHTDTSVSPHVAQYSPSYEAIIDLEKKKERARGENGGNMHWKKYIKLKNKKTHTPHLIEPPQNITVATWNANGLSGKIDALITLMIKHDIDLTFITETWASPTSKSPHAFIIAHSPFPQPSAKTRNSRGVAFCIHPRHWENRHEFKVKVGGMAGVSASLTWRGISINGIYLAPSLNVYECKVELNHVLDISLDNAILLGDFNMRLGALTGDSLMTARGKEILPWLGGKLGGLTLCPSSSPHSSFAPGYRKANSTPDHIFASPSLFNTWCGSTVRADDDDGGSDHRVIQASFTVPQTSATEKPPAYQRLRLHKLQHQETAMKYQQQVEETLQHHIKGNLNVEQLHSLLTTTITSSAAKVLGFQRIKPRCPKLHTRELQAARRKRRAAYKSMQHINENSPPQLRKQRWTTYVEARTEERREVREAMRRCFQRFGNDLASKPAGEQLKVLRNMRNSRVRTSPTALSTDEENLERYRLHFQKMFTQSFPPTPLQQMYNTETTTIPFDEAAIWSALSTMPNSKAPGPSGLCSELLKAAGPSALRCIHELFSLVWMHGCVPEKWRTATIHPVHKKGLLTEIGNYRPICLTESLRKLFEKSVHLEINRHIEPLNIIQGGFRSGRSTVDQVTCLHAAIQERTRTLKKAPILCFLDITAAYDSVDRSLLWSRLQANNCPGNVIKVLKSLFDNIESTLSVQGRNTKKIQHQRGLLQGSALSPTLYAYYIDELSASLQAQARGSLNSLPIAALLYADDIALIADDEDHLKSMLTICEQHASWYHYSFAPRKCLIVSDPTQTIPAVKLHGEDIQRTPSFNYLGIPFTHKGIDGAAHSVTVAHSALTAMNFFSALGVNGRGLPITTRMSVVRTFIRPKLEYGMCLLQKQQLVPITMAWNKILRLAFSVPKTTSTKAIQALSGLPTMVTRHRVLLTKWLMRVRTSEQDKTVFHAYRAHQLKPHKSTPFRLTTSEPLLAAFTGNIHPQMQLNQRVRDMMAAERNSTWTDRVVQQWAPKTQHTLTLQRKLDAMLDRRAAHALCRWMAGRPFHKPTTCKKCNLHGTSAEHVQICSSQTIDLWIRNLNLVAAAAGIKLIMEDCLHIQPRWATRVRDPP